MLRRVVAYGLVVVVVAPIPLGVLWLLYKAEPAGYTQPGDFTFKDLQREAALLVEPQSRFVNTMIDKSNDTPLDVTFTDAMITNGYIRSLPADELQKLPSWLWNPQVVFDEDEVVLMADVDVRNVKTILSLQVVPTATEDGQLKLRMSAMRAGRLPLPDAVARALVSHAERRIEKLKEQMDAPDKDKRDKDDWGSRMELETMIAFRGLLSGQEVVVDTRQHHLHLTNLELLPHRLRIEGKRVDKPKNNR